MSATTRVGTAVAAGYVLGRFKKLRLAVLAGTALANKQVRDAGLGLIRQGSGQLPDSAESGQNGLGRKLLDEARSAATAVAASRMDSISDRLRERTVAMGGGSEESDGAGESGDAEYDDQADEGQDEYDDSEDDYDEDSEKDPDEEYDEEPEDEDSGEQHRSSRRRRAAAPAGGR